MPGRGRDRNPPADRDQIGRAERDRNRADRGGKSGQSRIGGSHLLVAAGRKPRVETLDLDRAGVKYGKQGITVDRRLRTTARGV